jgi:Polysaccharide lyase
MRKRFAALVVASALVVPAAAEAAPTSGTPVDASASQATQKTMKAALRKDVKRALKVVAKRDLASIASKGFTLKRIRALTPGRVSLTATARSTAGQRISVIRGSRAFGKLGKKNVRVKLTRAGKRLLDTSNRVTLRLRATFRPSTGRRVTVVLKVTLKRKPGSLVLPEGGTPPPAVPAEGIPVNATPLYSQNFEASNPADWDGLPQQCPSGTVASGSENGDGYAHLTVLAGNPPTVPGDDLERCELSHGGYDDAREPGEYYYHARIKLGPGFPHDGTVSSNWTTIQQWQEDRPAAGTSTGLVDAALFVNSNAGPTGRMFLQGEALPTSQSGVFDYYQWRDFVVHGVWTEDPAQGYLEWSIDGTPVGRTNGVTSQTAGRHFWKGGITRAPSVDSQQEAFISEMTVYRAP